eukprot:GSChrysophyteH2.ASY1.ANO1.1430.1 assembled CDS
MPVTGQYSFSEKADKVVVQVPLKGCSPAKVDIFVTTTTLKINYAPNLIDIVLGGTVDAVRHKAKVKEGVLHVTLLKTDAEGRLLSASTNTAILKANLWGSLASTSITDKHELTKAKEAALEGNTQLQEKMALERRDRRIDDEKHALRKQMALEEREKSLLENLKQEEKTEAEERVYKEFAEMEKRNASAAAHAAASTQKKTPVATGDDIDSEGEEEEEEEEHMETQPQSAARDEGVVEDDANDADIKYVPPPRSAGYNSDTRIEINYTPRIFPTPMRESKAGEEEDWVAKNRQHLKKNAVLNKNVPKGKGVDVSESDPNWLKGKGDDFFRTGDFKSAINAYSAALDADDQMTACYSNRSACYMKLAMHDECVHDCKTAINQIRCDPALVDRSSEISPVSNQLHKLYVRRGAASCLRGCYGDAINDYSQVLFVFFTVESIQEDIKQIRTLSEGDALKKDADKIFATGDVKNAARMYSEALDLLPVHVGCFSNRSACKMALGDTMGCIDDCSAALALLQLKPDDMIGGGGGSEKRASWVIKTVVRRGAAYAQLGKIDEAVDDYTLAASLNPSDEKLKKDLNNIRNYRQGMTENAKKAEITQL